MTGVDHALLFDRFQDAGSTLSPAQPAVAKVNPRCSNWFLRHPYAPSLYPCDFLLFPFSEGCARSETNFRRIRLTSTHWCRKGARGEGPYLPLFRNLRKPAGSGIGPPIRHCRLSKPPELPRPEHRRRQWLFFRFKANFPTRSLSCE